MNVGGEMVDYSGLTSSSPNFCPARTLEYDPLGKQGLCRCNQFKMKPYWIQVPANFHVTSSSL